MDKKQKHLLTLISVTLLLLVVLVSIAVAKQTLDFTAWLKPVVKPVTTQVKPAQSAQVQAVANITTSSSEYKISTDKLAATSAYFDNYQSIAKEVMAGNMTTNEAVLVTIDKLISLTQKINTAYGVTFNLDNTQKNPRDFGTIVPDNSKFAGDIKALTDLKDYYTKNPVKDMKVSTDVKNAVNTAGLAAKEIVAIMKKIQDYCVTSESDQSQGVCVLSVLPISGGVLIPDTAPATKALVDMFNKAMEDGTISQAEFSLIMLDIYSNYEAIIAEWKTGSMNEFYGLVMKALDTVDSTNPLYADYVSLEVKLVSFWDSITKIQTGSKDLFVALGPLASFLQIPWQYNVLTGASGQMEVYLVSASLKGMANINMAAESALGKSNDEASKTLLAKLVELDDLITTTQSLATDVTPKVNVGVKVSASSEKKDYAKLYDDMVAQMKALLQMKADGKASLVINPTSSLATCDTTKTPNEAILADGCKAVDVYSDLKTMTANYMQIWQTYLKLAVDVAKAAK